MISVGLKLGGYFPSEESLNTNMFILLENIGAGWDKKPVPVVGSPLYELRQIYAMKFELDSHEILHNIWDKSPAGFGITHYLR